ncbi:MAG: signal recognition particle-docking protein FtsY [Peptoniphilus sp.]|uniref:signal recognition particle-docking protein FtsY n=1 Tax=Peptoniphilus sp. TaxID=1971214 RepID=UPI002A7629BB|nr:signal recognition particle-docking protein FtsY [Peptoniphilus sp.]MDY2986582.1 signal recognition particle-docking protein FtsY [Peptoniphilus sp.]
MFKWIKDKFKGNKAENIEEIDLKKDIVKNTDVNVEENKEEVPTDSVEEIPSLIEIEDYKEEIKTVEEVEGPISVDNSNKFLDEKIEEIVEEVEDFNNVEEPLEEIISNKNESNDIVQESEEEKLVFEEIEEKPKFNLFKKLKDGLSKTRQEMGVKINTILGAYVKIDDELLEDLEDILISADIGMETTMKLIDNLRETVIQEKINDTSKVIPLLKEEIKKIMNPNLDSTIETSNQTVILVIGVNGVGKTTTIGKLSSKLRSEGKSVLIAAADTFRAAAIDQLKTWGNRANVDVISHSEGADPAAVIYDGISAAKSRNVDVLVCDTAGRLHNKANLMKELEKINKIISRDFPNAKRETLLVLDATTGQNALSQAKLFKEAADITGIVLTKLDGTAKGGVVIALQSELGIPIKLVGVGEKIEDLQKFEMDSFIDAILE